MRDLFTSPNRIFKEVGSPVTPTLTGVGTVFPGSGPLVVQNNVLQHSILVDTLHRTFIDTSTNSFAVGSWNTADIVSQIAAWGDAKDRDVAVLKSVANWQRKYINYQATYSAFLLGALTEDEFETESATYISDIKNTPPQELAPVIGQLQRLLDFELGEGELAEFFEVDANSIKEAHSYLPDRTDSDNAQLYNVHLPHARIEG